MPLTRAEMVKRAEEAGFGPISERLVTDWAQLGLLDHPQRLPRPDGTGRGAYYAWPDIQGDLLLQLLEKRRAVTVVGTLCVIPVAAWLYWGDDWISLSQTRRALLTWSGSVGFTKSWERAEHDARVVTTVVFEKQGSKAARRAFAIALTEQVFRQDVDEPLLLELAQGIFGKRGLEAGWGPFAFTLDEAIGLVVGLLVGLERCRSMSDGEYYEARARHRQAMLGYFRDWAQLSAHPTFGHWFEEPTYDLLMRHSCRDLLLNLGLLARARDRNDRLNPIELDPWGQGSPTSLRGANP